MQCGDPGLESELYKKRFVEKLVSLSIRIPGCKQHETETNLVKQGLWEIIRAKGRSPDLKSSS